MLSEEEKVELFSDVREIKTKVDYIKERVDTQPCSEHNRRINDNSVAIEKAKYSVMMSVIAIILSVASALVGVVPKLIGAMK
jgi:hypothetical protein